MTPVPSQWECETLFSGIVKNIYSERKAESVILSTAFYNLFQRLFTFETTDLSERTNDFLNTPLLISEELDYFENE